MNFYNTHNDIYISHIIDSCELINNIQVKSDKLNNFLRSDIANTNDLTFYTKKKYISDTKSKYILTNLKLAECFDKDKILLISHNLNHDIAVISNIFYSSKSQYDLNKLKNPIIGSNSNISKNSFINNGVIVGNNFSILEYSSIDHSCIIGNDVTIGKNVSISNCIIGDGVTIGDGSKIGQAGFGFSFDGKNKPVKIFHIGRVIIQNGVNLHSNCTIDRGSFDDTIIGENTFLDNQVHIAHNVKIGVNCIIAAQTGIAGSTYVGNNVQIGGQVGIAGHLNISNNVQIAAKSGVIQNINEGEIVMGYPAIKLIRYLKNYKKIM